MKADFHVQTSSRAYPVHVSNRMPQSELDQLLAEYGDECFLIIDENVDLHFGEEIRAMAGSRLDESRICRVPSGESSKSVAGWSRIVDFLLRGGARRNLPVLVAGGGVTGDLAGFAVSSALRGLPLIHIPTTLLAMVDSSIGGKTGINHELGKNLIGSFYQPSAIFINTSFLSRLPGKEWINGLSEILKYGAIRDRSIFETAAGLFLEGDGEVDPLDPQLVELIRKCAGIKADIVGQDEKESNLRMILNFGHTFAHALENLGGYEQISHGEAVYTGMLAALHLSNRRGASLQPEILEKFRRLYRIDPSRFSGRIEELNRVMYRDKKRSTSRLKFVLLQDWNRPYVTELEDESQLADSWNYAFEMLSTRPV